MGWVAIRNPDTRLNQLRDARVQVQGGDRIGSACGVRCLAPRKAVEGILEVCLGHGLLADRHSPPVGRPFEHERDREARGKRIHRVVTGQDELRAPLDHRLVGERHRPHATPHSVARLEHGHFRSAGAQRVGGGESGEPGADDTYLLH